MDVTVGYVFCRLIQFFQPLAFRLDAGRILSHLLHHTFDVCSSPIILLAFIVLIIRNISTDWL